jgi:hypothetical protein
MEKDHISIQTLIEKAEEYSKTSVEIFKLKSVDKLAHVISSLLIRISLLIILSSCITLLNIGLSLWIGDLLGKTYYGFLVVAGVYAFIALLLNSYLNIYIKVPVSSFIINLMLDQKTL